MNTVVSYQTISLGIFLLMGLFLAYVLAGYPLLLAWMARRFEKPVSKRLEPLKVSVVIAVYNGGAFLEDKLKSVFEVDYPRELMEIVVVSDGSDDRTDDIARSFAGRGVRLLRVPRGGKAAALNAGLAEGTGEILLLTDVRQELEPESLGRLVACFADPEVGVVSGELVMRQPGSEEEASVGLYWRYERWIRLNLGRLDSMFGATGPLYAMRRELARPMPRETLLDDMYLPLGAFFRGYRLIVEEGARCSEYCTDLGTEFGRKVRTQAGNYQILKEYPQLLTFSNRMLFHFLSYKLARLLLPFALLVAMAASFGLPSPARELALLCQLLFYGLAAADTWIGGGSPLKRVSSPVRTFVGLMLAGVCALQVFFVPAQKLWRPTTIRNRSGERSPRT